MTQTAVRSLLSFLLICAATLPAWSADLSGRITDRVTRASIRGVHVMLVGQGSATETNEKGEFHFAGLSPGSDTVRASMVGYLTAEMAVTLVDRAVAKVQVQLEPSALPLPPVVVTATRTRASRIDVPSSVDVIPSADVARSQDLAQALIHVPGVVVKDYGSLGDIKTISIRGSSSGQVLVLMDGQRLNSAQSGEVDLSAVPLDAVDRIEVVRGGASALYGADAVGGVVNIITAGSGEPGFHADATVQTGSFGTWGGSVRGEGGGDQFTGQLSMRYLTSKGNFSYHDPLGSERVRANADAITQSASGGVRWSPVDGGLGRVATATVRYFHSESGSPGTLDQLNLLARKKSTDLLGRLSYEQELGSAVPMVRAELFSQRMDFSFDDAASYVPVHSSSRNGAWGAELQSRIVPDRAQTITAGTALRQDRLTGNELDATHDRRLWSAYAQDEVLLSLDQAHRLRLTIIPALRWDSFSDVGAVVSPRAGIVFRIDQDLWLLSARAHYGQSFRAPTFNDLYWPRDNFAVGNPLLSPERARDMEVGLNALLPSFFGAEGDLSFFWNRVNDMIVWQTGAQGIWSPTNVGRADLKGMETRVAVSPWQDHLRFAWSYTLLDAINLSNDPLENGRQLPYRPRHVHQLSLDVTQGRLTGSVQLAYTGRRFITTSSNVGLPAYRTLDAALSYTWGEQPVAMKASLEARNLTDARYQTIDGFPMPGREFRLFISLRLRDSSQ